MEQRLNIQNIEATTSKAGKKYYKIQTDQGGYSCFEGDVVAQLREGKTYDVETASNGTFKNIRKVLSEFTGIETIKPTEFTNGKAPTQEDKHITMKTSYGKDILVAMIGSSKEMIPYNDFASMAAVAANCVKIIEKELS